jgi:subtilase family serine protease
LVYLGTVEPDACTAAGQVLTCTFIPNLQAGASDHIEILVHATRNGALFTIEAQADAANLIAESNETNNGATMTVVVGGGPARS